MSDLPIVPDYDETARLVLMLNPDTDLGRFARQLRVEHGNDLSIQYIAAMWKKYRGFDGREAPTHNYETGKRL